MASVHFTQNLQRHVACPSVEVEAATVKDALEQVFGRNPRLRAYVVDEHGAVRKHMNVFVDGEAIHDRRGQSDAIGPRAEIYVMQALSGG